MGASARDTAIIGSRYVRPGLRGLESRPRRLAGAYAPTLAAEDEVRRDNHPFELLRRIPLLLVVRRRPRVAALAVQELSVAVDEEVEGQLTYESLGPRLFDSQRGRVYSAKTRGSCRGR